MSGNGKIAYTVKKDIKEAVNEILEGLELENTKDKRGLIVCFVSYSYNLDNFASEMSKSLENKNIDFIGCMSCGEFISGLSLENSIVAINLLTNVMDYYIELIDTPSVEKIDQFLANAKSHFGLSHQEDFDISQYVGLILSGGTSLKEETMMNILSAKSDLIFVGGSSADNFEFKYAPVIYNSLVKDKGFVLCVLKPYGYQIIKTQSMSILPYSYTVTKADFNNKAILELDYKPAGLVYKNALRDYLKSTYNLEIKDEDFDKLKIRYPLGIVVEGQPFVRSVKDIFDDKMTFYCAIEEGSQVNLLESRSKDIVTDTISALYDTVKDDKYSALIAFNCGYRKLELLENSQLPEYADIFSSINTIGFHTYGEQYITHINHTLTALLLK
ncbi:hypothetical protein ELD05_11315 [Caldicellulosiruptor changbaiensis]|uniref:Histidine kinase n=1 Tax=Caldicellulosiruptor changbaiensis TaxID=1222016 RepID=A0A3T0D7N1_9FIRM|nr:FIST N-terminal domain-containing protein [Caldicellulosiruptor changbaiensis]AZT91171.1 hypothetical protein ELD05_11315 [Caldicellulosiruptor changbaiensis]